MNKRDRCKRRRLTALVLCALTLCACGVPEEPSPESAAATVTPTATVTPEATATAVPTTAPEETTSVTPVVTPTPIPTATPAAAYIGKVACTAAEFVNIRSGAGTNTDIVGRLPAGAAADLIAYDGNWAQIVYEGVSGFVSRDYIVRLHGPSITVPAGAWTQILVNQWSLLPDGFTVELADFKGGQVDARILGICTEMFADAEEDGVKFKLYDAYRSFETQSAQFEAKVQSYINKGYSREEAEKKASTITARPNTSEHQTGLALDIVTPSYTKRDSGFADTQAFKWLSVNAANYGFIMRYAKGKTDITGVIYEPWHWRFAGVEAARAMKESGKSLEEYLG